MSNCAGIAGAGLSGRLLAEELSHHGWRVTLFDRDQRDGVASCGHIGAGMLAPFCELEHAEPLVSDLGCLAMERWPEILPRLARPVFFQRQGSLVVAHSSDRGDLDRLRRQVERHAPEAMERVAGQRLADLEPELAGRFADGLFFPREGQIDNRQLMDALAETLVARGVDWRTGCDVRSVRPGAIVTADGEATFDWAIDCRGLGAQVELPGLRGVRGEVLRVHAPEVRLQRPVRLIHPRYPIYIVPREQGHFVIGATQLESEDMSPVSVRSLLELLSATYALHSGFAEARVLETGANCRPAFADNLPRLEFQPGRIRLNGLFRHGFLLAPALVKAAVQLIERRPLNRPLTTIVREPVA